MKAAAEEISLVGIGRASLDVIARQAGVSRSTLYRRFPTRDDLITELARRTFAFAMTRLQTVATDSGPKDAAVACFCEGVRLLSQEPTMRRFLQLDGDFTVVASMRTEGQRFLDSAGAAMAKALRSAGATMPDDDLIVVADLHIRLATSLAQVPSGVLDTADEVSVRRYATTHLAQLVY